MKLGDIAGQRCRKTHVFRTGRSQLHLRTVICARTDPTNGSCGMPSRCRSRISFMPSRGISRNASGRSVAARKVIEFPKEKSVSAAKTAKIRELDELSRTPQSFTLDVSNPTTQKARPPLVPASIPPSVQAIQICPGLPCTWISTPVMYCAS